MTLILTLKLDDCLQDFFNEQRLRYFPKHLNQIPAHVSVFHQLPKEHFATIDKVLQTLVDNNAPLEVSVTGIQFLGQGNAYALQLDKEWFISLQKQWWTWLIPQDKQSWRPHVTIQNKVSNTEAKTLHQQLQTSFEIRTGTMVGFSVWNYLNGPWQLHQEYFFNEKS